MSYQISPIVNDQQAKDALDVAKKVFGPSVSVILPSPPLWGFIAHDDTQIVGAVLLHKASETEGVLEWIYVDPIAQGQHLASVLMDTGEAALDEAGLTTHFTLVRDDNTASWNMFVKRGYRTLTVLQSLFSYTPKSFLKRFMYSLASGYTIWIKDPKRPDISIHQSRFAILKTILFSIFIGAGLSLFSIRGVEYFFIALFLVPSITILRMIVAYPFARQYGKVRFKSPHGGTSLSALVAVAFGGWWPTFGLFVPDEDIWNSRTFAPYEGKAALASWISILVYSIVGVLLFPDIFASGLHIFLILLIAYQCIPTFPFEGMDGFKVLHWSKSAYFVGLILSILSILAILSIL